MRMSRAIRAWAALLAVATCWNVSAAAEDDRRVFLYRDGNVLGALIYDRGTRWVENVGGVEKFVFEETRRTDEMIEFLDRPRDVGLKVFADKGELRLPRATEWRPWMSGRWVQRTDLPAQLPFVPTDQKIRLVYFVPQDREPVNKYAEKIRVVMELVADVYSKALRQHGIVSPGPALEIGDDGLPVVHLVQTSLPARHYSGAPDFDDVQHFRRVLADLPASVGTARRHMLVVFPETYEAGPAPIEWAGSVGRGMHLTADGGLAVMSAWILRDEFCGTSLKDQIALLLDRTPIEGRTALGTRKVDSPRFEFIEDGFGAVVHELGHALGLPHDTRGPQDIMGYGFRSLQLNYQEGTGDHAPIGFSRDNSRLLSVSRYLVPGLDLADDVPPTAEMKVRLSDGPQPEISIDLTARDDRELRAVLFVDLGRDTVIGSADLKGVEHSRKLKFPVRLGDGGTVRLQAKVADASGNILQVDAEAR